MHTKLIVLVSLLSLPVVTSAQSTGPTARGNALVGGTASFTRATQTIAGQDETTTFVEFSPHILYFVAPRVAIGGVLGYGRASNDESSSTSYTLGPEGRVFLADAAAKAQPYLGASVAREWGKFESDFGSGKPKSTRYTAVAGVIWMVTRQVGLSSEAFYQRITDDNAPANFPEVKNSGLGLRFGFAAFLMR